MKVENFELIKLMDLGQSWQEALPTDAPLPSQYIREFHHLSDDEVTVRLFYRGAPLARQVADKLTEILNSPQHKLSETEKVAVTMVIRSASDPESFQIERLETTPFNGRSALLIQGVWTEAESKFLAIYVPEDIGVHGQTIHEFQYYAPPSKFDEHLPDALRVFQSIEWR